MIQFYFVFEDTTTRLLSGDSLDDIREEAIRYTEQSPKNSGFVGAIDGTGKLRGTLMVHSYRGKFRNALFDFIRKYQGIDTLETLSRSLREKQQ